MYYVFTHINTKSREEFVEFLQTKLPKKFKYTKFINTISIKISSVEELEAIKSAVSKVEK